MENQCIKNDKGAELIPEFSHRKCLYQYLATVTGTLAILVSGMHFGWPSPSLPQLLDKDSPFPVTSSEGAWVAVMPCIGAPPGAILCALIVDRIGRKTCLMMISPLYFLTWLAIAYTPNLVFLIITRFIVGILDGVAFTVTPMYIGEISDRRIRGLLGCSISVTFVFGFLVINLFGLYFSIRTTALISSVVPIIHFATFFWMPESPYYYITKRQGSKATASLKKLTGATNVQEEINKLTTSIKMNSNTSSTRLGLLKDKGSRKALITVLGLRLVQQFSGNSTIAFYCLIIFNEAGGSISGSTATIIYFTVQLIVSVLSCFLVDKIGRRPLLIISVIGSGIALAVQGVYFYLKNEINMDLSMLGFLPLVALILYNMMYNIGLGTIPMLVLGEVFPVEVKAVACCIVDIFYGAYIVIALKAFQILYDEIGIYVPFFMYAACCAGGLVFIVLYVVETKGKTLEEIQIELKGAVLRRENPCVIELKAVHESLLTVTMEYQS